MCVDNDAHTCSMPLGEQCPICMEDITELTGFVQTPCGHKYGADCFIAYLTTYNSVYGIGDDTPIPCPYCRQDITDQHLIPEEQYYPQYVVLPHNPGCENECGHHYGYKYLIRIASLKPGEEIYCRDDKRDWDFYCRHVIYTRPAQTTTNISDISPSRRFAIFATTYNVMRLVSGLGGLAYSN